MDQDFCVVALGASAGGLDPLKKIISNLDTTLNAAIVVVTHLSENFPSSLSHILSAITTWPVIKVEKDMELKAGIVYVLPEGKFMTVSGNQLILRDRLDTEIINKAIDIFFKSMGVALKQHAIGVILSGAGYDGIEGAKVIEDGNGIVIVQDPATAQFPLMPQALIANDHPDYVLSPEQIVSKITDYVSKTTNQAS